MSKADKMFKKLGYDNSVAQNEFYKKIASDTNGEISENIEFNIDSKIINAYTNTIIYINKTVSLMSGKKEINMQELQAINEKVKELGWIE